MDTSYKLKYTGEEIDEILEKADTDSLTISPQSLTEAQKTQVRENIGVTPEDDRNIRDGEGEGSTEQLSSTALGQYSSAFGYDSKTGLGASHLLGFDIQGLKIFVDDASLFAQNDGLCMYVLPLNTSINSVNYEAFGIVESIDTSDNSITVSQLPANLAATIADGINTQSSYIFVPSKSVGEYIIGTGAHTEGYDNEAMQIGAHAEGALNKAVGKYSHVENNENVALGWNTHVEGFQNSGDGHMSHTEGYMNQNHGSASHVEGQSNTNNANQGHVEGYNNQTTPNAPQVHMEGNSNRTTQSGTTFYAMHIEGIDNEGGGNYTHVEGQHNTVSGNGSHAEGGSNTITSSNNAHAEGDGNSVTAHTGHVEGYHNVVNGQSAHAEGRQTEASSYGAHAEGFGGWAATSKVKATESGSHAEGRADGGNIVASGQGAHAEGYAHNGDLTASGLGAHAEGENTTAAGEASHAGGIGTIANGVAQTVVGKYNVADNESLLIVGNGTGSNNRSNALRVDQNGVVAGSLTASSLEVDYANNKKLTVDSQGLKLAGDYSVEPSENPYTKINIDHIETYSGNGAQQFVYDNGSLEIVGGYTWFRGNLSKIELGCTFYNDYGATEFQFGNAIHIDKILKGDNDTSPHGTITFMDTKVNGYSDGDYIVISKTSDGDCSLFMKNDDIFSSSLFLSKNGISLSYTSPIGDSHDTYITSNIIRIGGEHKIALTDTDFKFYPNPSTAPSSYYIYDFNALVHNIDFEYEYGEMQRVHRCRTSLFKNSVDGEIVFDFYHNYEYIADNYKNGLEITMVAWAGKKVAAGADYISITNGQNDPDSTLLLESNALTFKDGAGTTLATLTPAKVNYLQAATSDAFGVVKVNASNGLMMSNDQLMINPPSAENIDNRNQGATFYSRKALTLNRVDYAVYKALSSGSSLTAEQIASVKTFLGIS